MADGGLPPGFTSNGNSIAMQLFFRQHLLELVRPVSESVSDLRQLVSKLSEDAQKRDKSVTSQGSTLGNHEEKLRELSLDLAQAKTRMGLVQSTSELLSRRVNQQGEAFAQATSAQRREESRLQDLAALVQGLQGNAVTDRDHVNELRVEARQTRGLVDELVGDRSKLTDAIQGLGSECSSISTRLTKQGESAQRSLAELSSSVARQVDDVRRGSEDLAKRLEHTREETTACLENVRLLEARMDRKIGELGAEQTRLSAEQETQTKYFQEHEISMKGLMSTMNVQQAIVMAFERLDKAEREIGCIAQESRESRRSLSDKIYAFQKTVGSLPVEIARIDKEHKVFDIQVHKAVRRLDEQCHQHLVLKDRFNSIDGSLKSLTSSNSSILGKLEVHGRDVEKAQQGLNHHERTINETGLMVSSLAAEVSAAAVGMSKTAMRIDLAHDYLSGMGKGLQDAQTRVAEGRGGTDTLQNARMLSSQDASKRACDEDSKDVTLGYKETGSGQTSWVLPKEDHPKRVLDGKSVKDGSAMYKDNSLTPRVLPSLPGGHSQQLRFSFR